MSWQLRHEGSPQAIKGLRYRLVVAQDSAGHVIALVLIVLAKEHEHLASQIEYSQLDRHRRGGVN